ncbi:Chromatin associated protein KTI12 [Penicillium digitatum]|uniref:Uncharacterized protein n=3 Tax=Penicillium digitatum TaxID=36651 RepID=K9F5H2_PEND2|nr:hypothetical protein PDIP_07190 [Penicillium digitatum Pd1]EKV04269.1 hypothetical protein PDIG_90260 [Penicillium digitatum PHI26]EKV21377.1 hypothetical protein PDIP_07190 [Penicillium digitatum Pd1]KAG0154272.1 hypothetical protein PDIDSM_1652 [Penicillium digitatum]QQK47993.1 Chromatin associated protein KTI12 [Penicillium digitatum]
MTASVITRPRRPIVHLNGFPGVGKLTIARYLAKQLPSAKLVHNHLLINPADAVLHRTQPGYQTLRRGIRNSIFSALINEPATFDTTYVFTDFQSDDELGATVCAEYLATAEARHAALVPILLFCDEKTNMQRLVSSDRELHAKLTDVELVTQFRREGDVHRFTGHPNYLEIDVSNFTPDEAAKQICEHIRRVCPDL